MEPNNNTPPINPDAPAATPNLANAYEALPTPPITSKGLRTPELIPVDTDIKDKATKQMTVRQSLEYKDTSDFDSMGASTKMKSEVRDIDRSEYVELSSGKMIPRFLSNVKGLDNEELLANQQTSTKWVQKFAAKTAVNVFGNTIGVVEGLVNVIKEQSFSAIYDSDFNNYLEDLNKTLDYKLPTYYTAQEKDMNFFQQLGTSNFYSDKLMGGLSFLTGTIISEGLWAAATGGTSLIGKGILGAATRLGTKAMAKGAIGTLKAVKSRTKTLLRGTAKNQVKDITGAALKGSRLSEGLHTARFFYTSAGYEAGVETRQYMTETKAEWEQQFKLNNGREPSQLERLEFTDKLTNTGNMLYLSNVGLVGSSNVVILGKVLLNPAPTRAISNNIFKKALFGMGYTKKAGKLAITEANTAQKVFRRVAAIGKPVLMEGFVEEGGQAALSTASKDYVLSAYSTDETEQNLSAIDALAKGFHHAYGTKEGLVEVGLGSLIGLLGGGFASGGKFSEYSSEAKAMEETVKYVNQFGVSNFIENLKASNKINTFTKKSEQAMKDGKLSEVNHADNSAAIALIDRGYYYQSVDEVIKDFNTGIEVTDNATLAAELGITVEEAQQWKDAKKADFTTLAEEHFQNLEFAEVYLGESAIAGIDKLEGLNEAGVADLKGAIAYTLTMGTRSDAFAQDLAAQIKMFVANKTDSTQEIDAITVSDVLRKVSNSKIKAFENSSGKLKKAKRALELAEVAAIDAQNAIENKEDNTAFKNRISKANQKLVTLQGIVAKLQAEKELAFEGLNLELYSKDEVITEEMLDNQEKNLKKLDTTIQNNSLVNPQDATAVKHLIEEYSRAAATHRNYSKVIEGIVNNTTRVNILNGWASSLINRNKKLNGDTAALFEGMVKTYNDKIAAVPGRALIQEKNVKIIEDFENNVNPVEQVPEDITEEVPDKTETTTVTPPIADSTKAATTPIGNVIKAIKAQIQHILNSDEYTQSRYVEGFEETLENAKPTEQELTDYETLTSKINPGKKFKAIILNPYNSKNKTGLTKEETEKLKALNRKLSNWKILDGSNVNGSSVAELLQLVSQLENSKDIAGTKSVVEVRELFTPKKSETKEGTKSTAQLNTIVTPDIASAKKIKDTNSYEFSFLSVGSLLRLFPNSKLLAVVKNNLIDTNTMPKDKLDAMSKLEGSEFVLEIGEVKLSVKIGDRQRLIIDSTELESLLPDSNLRILDFGDSNFMPLFIKDTEGNFAPLEGDFTLESIDENELITLEGDKFYELEKGTILKTVVNLNDTFNAELIKKYKAGVMTKEEAINSLHIYITTQGATTNILGSLRAITPNTNTKIDTYAKLYRIRKQAFKKALQTKNTRVDVGITVELGHVSIGKPNLVVREEGNEVLPNNIQLTPEALDMIDDYGYMIDGKLITNRKNLQYSPKDIIFAKAISGRPENAGVKVPVVIFKYKNRVVVFPVSLVKTANTKTQAINQVLTNKTISDAAKIIEVNKILISYNINPNNYKISDLESEASLEEVARMLDEVENLEDFANVENWVNPEFNKDNLLTEVEIAIDITDKPFHAGMGSINLSSIALPTEVDLEIESVNTLDNLAKKIDLIFREKEPFRDMNDTKFYDAYTDKSGINLLADSYLMKKYNANLLRAAFKETIPRQVKEVLGADLVAQVKRELKQYQILNEGLRVKTEALEEGLVEEINNVENNCK